MAVSGVTQRVRCIECGLLGIPKNLAWARAHHGGGVLRSVPGASNYNELSVRERDELSSKDVIPTIPFAYPLCAKDVVPFLLDKIIEEYRRERECSHFLQHVPGLSPKEHTERELSLKGEKSRRRWQVMWGTVLFLAGVFVDRVIPAVIRYFQALLSR